MKIVYAMGDQNYRRHVTLDDAQTLCGKEAGGYESLALPVNCDECRTKNGELNRPRRNAPQSGYTPCACRDCMDTTVSSDTSEPELCTECKDAGCVAIASYNEGIQFCSTYECQRDDAYGEC